MKYININPNVAPTIPSKTPRELYAIYNTSIERPSTILEYTIMWSLDG